MFARPNADLTDSGVTFDPFALGYNQINLKFHGIFDVLLATQYFEGTVYARFYNKLRENGQSQAYVSQPETEKALSKFLLSFEDEFKFLVGFTGIGKTTVLRNYFRVFDRNVKMDSQNNLIIYHSFLSMSPNGTENGNQFDALSKSIKSTMINAICLLLKKAPEERLLECNNAYYNDLFEFIKTNNQGLISSYPDSPDFTIELKKENIKRAILKYIAKENQLDYT